MAQFSEQKPRRGRAPKVQAQLTVEEKRRQERRWIVRQWKRAQLAFAFMEAA